MEIYIEHHIYNPGPDREFQVELNIHYSPFRKGDPVDAWYGPTPDEPEEVILEEIWLHGELLLCSGHRFEELIGQDELFRLVNDYLEEQECMGAY